VATGREVLSVPAEATSPFAFRPDGKVLALNRPGQGIFLISVATGKDIAKITISVDDHTLNEMSFSPNGKLLAIASPDGLVLLDPAAGKQLFILTPGSDSPVKE
jgi:WD40 repeat protein